MKSESRKMHFQDPSDWISNINTHKLIYLNFTSENKLNLIKRKIDQLLLRSVNSPKKYQIQFLIIISIQNNLLKQPFIQLYLQLFILLFLLIFKSAITHTFWCVIMPVAFIARATSQVASLKQIKLIWKKLFTKLEKHKDNQHAL